VTAILRRLLVVRERFVRSFGGNCIKQRPDTLNADPNTHGLLRTCSWAQ